MADDRLDPHEQIFEASLLDQQTPLDPQSLSTDTVSVRSGPIVQRSDRAARSSTQLAVIDPTLGEHVSRSVRTGSWCSYAPDPLTPVTWHT